MFVDGTRGMFVATDTSLAERMRLCRWEFMAFFLAGIHDLGTTVMAVAMDVHEALDIEPL